jgi:radical SAM superfamily enzyme YgiQ (UPF0313 family)
MSARILLIDPPGWQKESINLGLCYVAGSLLRAGHDVVIIDMNAKQMSDEELAEAVTKFKPLVIGLSVKTATAKGAGRVFSLLSKRFAETVFVVGGPHITLCVDSFMASYAECDYAIMGEGEISFERLVAAVLNNTSPVGIEGVVYRDRGKIVVNPWEPPKDLDALPLPDLDVIAGFRWSQFRYPIVTSRGCPFDCIYCCVNKLTGSRKWRARSASNVVDELEYVVRTKGITHFEIWDDNLTLDINHAKSICREIIRRGLNLSWYCHNGIRADRINRELAVLMKNAGCTSIAFGIESGNPATFDSIKKGETLSVVVDAVQLVKDVGINAVGYFIIGLPGDTLERFIETVRFQRSLHLAYYIFGLLIPYPKTEVWDIVSRRGTFFCDITETQHFSSDIVPVSFELPEFPREDMVRAYYIAKYFELFDAVDELARGGKTATVIYLSTPSMIEHIPGMVIACPVGTKNVVVGNTMEQIRSLPSFGQVSEGAVLSFKSSLPSTSSSDNVVIVAVESMIPSLSCIRTAVIAFDPHNPLQHTARVDDHLDDLKYHFLRSKIVYWLKPRFSQGRIVLKNRLKKFRLARSLHHFFMHEIRHGLCVLRNRIILQRLRARDRLIFIRRNYSKKMTFLIDIIRFNKARKALRRVDSKKVKINFDEYSSYL